MLIARLYALETPKDPGIPNNFPYKDQILAEIAEGRRLVSFHVLKFAKARLIIIPGCGGKGASEGGEEDTEDAI